MNKLIGLILVLVFLSGCTLSGIKPYRRSAKPAPPAKKTVVEKVREVFVAKPVIVEEPQEKEEILPIEPIKEVPIEEEDIK